MKDKDKSKEELINELKEMRQKVVQLAESLNEKRSLLREIHHQVKNNLQIISSLFNIQFNQMTDQKNIKFLIDCLNRLNSISLIHTHLYQSENLSCINLKKYIIDLVNQLLENFNSYDRNIKFKINIENILIDTQQTISLGLIINELISNSLEHAFIDRQEGKIKISLKQIPEDKIELIVQDNGVGIPMDIDLEDVTTVGLQLAISLVEYQLKGTIKLERDNGTKFSLEFRAS